MPLWRLHPVTLVTSLLCFEPSANPLEGPCGVVECGGGFVPSAAVESDAGSNALSKGDTVPVLRTGHEVQRALDEGSGDIESCVEPKRPAAAPRQRPVSPTAIRLLSCQRSVGIVKLRWRLAE
jgi:hypothetical protein